MTTRAWWAGITVLALAIVFHALFPRYEWRTMADSVNMIRVDRWTGRAQAHRLTPTGYWAAFQ